MPLVEYRTGAYCWTNRLTGKRYVGSSSTSLLNRFRFYFASLRGGYCHNRYLQNAWNKYGSHNFSLSVLERCSPARCLEREQYWIDFYRSAEHDFGYNISPTAGSSFGAKQTEEARANMTRAMRRIAPEISKRMIGNRNGAGVKRGPLSAEHKRVISIAAKKQFDSEESRKRMSEMKKALYASNPEVVERIRDSLIGRTHSQETKDKRAASLRGKKRTPEQKKRMSEAALRNRENRRKAALIGWYGSASTGD